MAKLSPNFMQTINPEPRSSVDPKQHKPQETT